jgi:hypothetical protein
MAERFGPMDQRLARLEAKAERLSAEGGRTYAAALSVEAEQRLTSANREMAGGLEEDARRDMNDADGMLEVIRLRIRQRGAQ